MFFWTFPLIVEAVGNSFGKGFNNFNWIQFVISQRFVRKNSSNFYTKTQKTHIFVKSIHSQLCIKAKRVYQFNNWILILFLNTYFFTIIYFYNYYYVFIIVTYSSIYNKLIEIYILLNIQWWLYKFILVWQKQWQILKGVVMNGLSLPFGDFPSINVVLKISVSYIYYLCY